LAPGDTCANSQFDTAGGARIHRLSDARPLYPVLELETLGEGDTTQSTLEGVQLVSSIAAAKFSFGMVLLQLP